MLEGACLFAGAISKKLGSQSSGVARFPFLVDATPVGSGAVGQTDEGREVWLPLWADLAGLDEVARLFAEARLEKFGQPATRGFDAFVALAQHGSDRGIAEFQRIGLVRGRIGGENYFTSFDQGRFRVREEKSINVLAELEDWYRSISDFARGDLCPASLRAALRSYESRVVRLTQRGGSEAALDVLLALGQLERTLSRSSAKARVRPVPPLSNDWLRYINSTGKEFRLAAALASTWKSHDGKYLPLRSHLEPVETKPRVVKRLENASNDVVWRGGALIETLNAIFSRRLVLAQQGEKHLADRSVYPIHFSDLAAFIDGDVEDKLIAELFWGLALLDWRAVKPDDLPAAPSEPEIAPSAFYALLKLCFTRPAPDEESLPLMPAIHRRAARGDGASASELAARRLRASGFAPAVQNIPITGKLARRTAAALLFPIRTKQMIILRKTILRPELEPATAL
jgi:CRISPR-associated protein Csx17